MLAPLLQESEPFGLVGVPPEPLQPPLLQETQDPPEYAWPFAQDTETVTDWSAEVPPAPEHWRVKVVFVVSGVVRPLPERLPEVDHGPPAVQEVASVEDQVRVERLPTVTEAGEAERVAVGTGGVKETPLMLTQPTFVLPHAYPENVVGVGRETVSKLMYPSQFPLAAIALANPRRPVLVI